jgi:hypothetical protein
LAVWLFFQWQFIPHYQAAHPSGNQLDIGKEDFAVFLRTTCEDRLAFLSERGTKNWNHDDFSIENLDAYMVSTRIAGVIDRVQTPLVLLSSRDDPAVEHAMFEKVKVAALDNPWVAVYETNDGGHCGFDFVYGKEYVSRIIRLMLNPKVYLNWNPPLN